MDRKIINNIVDDAFIEIFNRIEKEGHIKIENVDILNAVKLVDIAKELADALSTIIEK